MQDIVSVGSFLQTALEAMLVSGAEANVSDAVINYRAT